MAAKIGLLGESTVATVARTVVYTVPASKAAKVRVLFAVEGDAGTDFSFSIGGGHDYPMFSCTNTSSINVGSANIIQGPGEIDLSTSAFDGALLAPLAIDYYMSTGDEVSYEIANNAAAAVLFQVVGVEDDA